MHTTCLPYWSTVKERTNTSSIDTPHTSWKPSQTDSAKYKSYLVKRVPPCIVAVDETPCHIPGSVVHSKIFGNVVPFSLWTPQTPNLEVRACGSLVAVDHLTDQPAVLKASLCAPTAQTATKFLTLTSISNMFGLPSKAKVYWCQEISYVHRQTIHIVGSVDAI